MDRAHIGFIGTGVMGSSMARNLMRAGYPVSVYTRTKKKAQALLDAGACWASSPAELSKEADVVISIVGYPKDVEEIYLGAAGVLSVKKGGAVIDMTTSSPALAKKIFAAAKEKGVDALDAPVSGGDIGARDASLAIMVGGEKEAFERYRDIFAAVGKNVRYFGAAGSGQFVKMSNQIAIASNMLGVAEAMAYAKKSGLDAEAVQQTIAAGAAGSWSLTNLAPKMLAGDWSPGFFIKHFLKDMRIAIESAEEMGLDLPGLKLSKKLYDELSVRGMDDCGTQAIFRWYTEK